MYAIVDIETTGGHAAGNRITEIAIFTHDGTKLVDEYHTLVNPLQKIPVYITALTGISNAMVASAPAFEEIAGEVYRRVSNAVFVAHNVNFDYSFLKHQLGESGLELNSRKLCTVRLGRKVFPGLASYSLGNFCRSLGIEIENRHRAHGDAKATVKLFERLLQGGAEFHIGSMLKRSSGEQWMPLELDKTIIDSLPEGPGVYYFHNSKAKVIYVGKAINIKKRVCSHFTHNDPEKKRQNFLRLVTNISFQACSSEIHALVLESTEIRRLWPKYNFSQKQPTLKFGLYSYEDNRGYLRLAIDRKQKNLPAHYYFNLLHEGLVLLRNMIVEFGLHEKFCNLDKTPISEQDLGSIGAASAYNLRVSLALDALASKLPTFAIVDEGLQENERLCMLVEKGSFWGMGYIGPDRKLEVSELKKWLNPYADNDFIRNSIYSFAEKYPHKKVLLDPST